MRYISDLHIGKVNPKRLAFELDDESKKYDLPEFLRDNVVGASDVAGALAQVEPPYPGYRRTLQALQTYVELAKKDDGEQLPPPVAPKKTIAPGDTWPACRGSRDSSAWWATFRPTPMLPRPADLRRPAGGRREELPAPPWPRCRRTNRRPDAGRPQRSPEPPRRTDAMDPGALALAAGHPIEKLPSW
jgi:hypothetical protein